MSTPIDSNTVVSDCESGYVSGSNSEESLPDILFTKPHLKYLNEQLRNLEPQGTGDAGFGLWPLLTIARNTKMGHTLTSESISNHRVRPYGFGDGRHAVQDRA
jgi:hypothetical protein